MNLIMMGTGDFAVPTFRTLLDRGYCVTALVTQPDRPQGRRQELTPAVIKKLAAERGIEVFQPDDVNAADAVAWIAVKRPDLLVVAAYGQILSRELLAVPRLGGINLHASLLPKYRGAAPINWAIYHGEIVTGVTVIRMTAGLDAGAIVLQAETPIGPDETAGNLEVRLADLGAPLVCRTIDGLAAGTLEGRLQDRAAVTKAPKLKKEDGLIDWSRPAAAVCRQIRAMQPWPMPFTFYHSSTAGLGVRIIVERAIEPSDTVEVCPASFGSLLVRDGKLFVRTADGLVRVDSLRPAGKRAMSAAEFLRGHLIQPDARFGPEML